MGRKKSIMTKCKYYSDYDSDPHDSGVCHYDEYKYGGFPMICTHKDDEDNCTCFEPVKGQGLVFSPCEKIIFIACSTADFKQHSCLCGMGNIQICRRYI